MLTLTTEKSPLKETEQNENADETKEPIENGIKEVKPGHLVQQLNDPKIRLVIAVVAGVLLLLVAGGATVALLICGSQPGGDIWEEDATPRLLRLVPTPNGAKNLIKFRAGQGDEGRVWPNLTNEITNLYQLYDKGSKRVTNCGSRVTPPADINQTCLFDISKVQDQCNKENNYGYPTGTPCIYIQFNKYANFTPEVYTKEDLKNETLPELLRKEYQFTGPWVQCEPNDIPDKENAGKIITISSNELPRYSFPYVGHPDYMAPFVALKLENPTRGVNIGITCRLWARNVVYNQTASGLNDTTVDDVYVPSAILPFNIFIE